MRKLNGNATVALGVAGLVVLAWAILRDRAHRALLVTLALAGCAALPIYAFYKGHPFRIRYMVVLAMMPGRDERPRRRAAAAAAGAGGAPRRRRGADPDAGELGRQPPAAWSSTAPMVLEAQWDRPHSLDRRAVRACLARDRRGEPILASMGSLAHLMQETSADGINLRDYIHEGIGQIWADSLEHPARHAGLGADRGAGRGRRHARARLREHPEFLAGFDRVCKGGGVALYRRREDCRVLTTKTPADPVPHGGTGGRNNPDGQGCSSGREADANAPERLEAHVERGGQRTAAEIQLVAGEVQRRIEVRAATLPAELAADQEGRPDRERARRRGSSRRSRVPSSTNCP